MLADAGWYFYDPLHFTHFAAWTEVDVDAGEFQHHFFEGMSDMVQRKGPFEQTANEIQMCFAVPVGQESIVADAAKPLRQDVEKKSPDKLNRADGHFSHLIVLSILNPEGYRTIL